MKKFITLLLVLTGMVCTANADETWTVAGSSAALFGNTWNTENTDNDMTLVDGLYTWEKTGVTMDAEVLGFKIAKDHKWDEAYPSSDYYVGNLTVGRKYNVKITFNASTKEITTSFDKWPELSSVELRGSFSWWGSNALTLEEGVYTGTINLTNTTDDQWFKLVAFDTDGNEFWDYYGSSTDFSGCDDGLIAAETDGDLNFLLKNSTSGCKTYNVAVTWTPNVNLNAGWKVTISKATARPATTYTVKLLDDSKWSGDNGNSAVYAYAFSQEEEELVKYSGEWPGERICTSTVETINGTSYRVFTYTLESLPSTIIFNNGGGSQTYDFAFKDGTKYYSDTNYIVAGNSDMLGTWWNITDINNLMTRNASDGNYSLIKSNVELQKGGEYTYKVVTGPDWSYANYGKDGGSEDCELEIAEDGIYNVTFSINASTHAPTASAEMISRKATINSSYGCATFSSSNALDFTSVTGLEAYVATSAGKGYVHMEKVEGSVPANTGLFLTGETDYIPVTEYDTPVANNLLVPTDGFNIYDNTDGKCQYVLANQSEDVAFYRVVKDLSPAAGNAYLSTEGSVGDGASARVAIVFDDEISTGIKSIDNEKLNNGKVYNLNGQEVAQPTRGLYVVNGKKVIMK